MKRGRRERRRALFGVRLPGPSSPSSSSGGSSAGGARELANVRVRLDAPGLARGGQLRLIWAAEFAALVLVVSPDGALCCPAAERHYRSSAAHLRALLEHARRAANMDTVGFLLALFGESALPGLALQDPSDAARVVEAIRTARALASPGLPAAVVTH